MDKKLALLVIVAVAGVASVILAASQSSSKEVVTVADLMTFDKSKPVRLGARVATKDIAYETEPDFLVKFAVVDIPSVDLAESDRASSEADTNLGKTLNSSRSILPVEYRGIRPDTLQFGRDVILEGVVENGVFLASSLMTQCPSKYEPPSIGEDPSPADSGVY